RPPGRAKAKRVCWVGKNRVDAAEGVGCPFLSKYGKLAQLVEQRTENPCVPGSIPGLATIFRPVVRAAAVHLARSQLSPCISFSAARVRSTAIHAGARRSRCDRG